MIMAALDLGFQKPQRHIQNSTTATLFALCECLITLSLIQIFQCCLCFIINSVIFFVVCYIKSFNKKDTGYIEYFLHR